MRELPYATKYINEVFGREEKRLDYQFLRPLLLVLSFLLRCIVFPVKYVVHRRPYGFESRCIDSVLAFGPTLRIIVGRDDSLRKYNVLLSRRLKDDLGLAHSYKEIEGVGHEAQKIMRACEDETAEFYTRLFTGMED
jgi:hypothetical protein